VDSRLKIAGMTQGPIPLTGSWTLKAGAGRCEAHGGCIEASSIPGAEMTLRVSLPLAVEGTDLRT